MTSITVLTDNRQQGTVWMVPARTSAHRAYCQIKYTLAIDIQTVAAPNQRLRALEKPSIWRILCTATARNCPAKRLAAC